MLGVSDQTIRSWVKARILRGVRLNPVESEKGARRGKIMIDEASVEEAIEKGWI